MVARCPVGTLKCRASPREHEKRPVLRGTANADGTLCNQNYVSEIKYRLCVSLVHDDHSSCFSRFFQLYDTILSPKQIQQTRNSCRSKLTDFSSNCKLKIVARVLGTRGHTLVNRTEPIAKVYAMRHVSRRGTCRSGTRNDRYTCAFSTSKGERNAKVASVLSSEHWGNAKLWRNRTRLTESPSPTPPTL